MCLRLRVNGFVQIATWTSPFLAPLLSSCSCLHTAMGLATCWLLTQRKHMFLSEMAEGEKEEAKLLTWLFLSLLSQIPFDPHPLPGSSSHLLKSAVSSCWPPSCMGLFASCLTSYFNLPSLLQISADQLTHFQDSGHKAPFL